MPVSIVRPIDIWFADHIFPHEQRFHAAALRISGSRDEAEELVQEAFARLFELEGWAAIEDPRAYVVRMLRHIAIERLRRRRIVDFRQFADTDHLTLADDAPDQHRIAAGRERLRRVSDLIARLPERCRTVFVRRRIQGESSQEIARDLGISQSTYEKRLARAIELLSGSWQGDEDALPSLDKQAETARRSGGR